MLKIFDKVDSTNSTNSIHNSHNLPWYKLSWYKLLTIAVAGAAVSLALIYSMKWNFIGLPTTEELTIINEFKLPNEEFDLMNGKNDIQVDSDNDNDNYKGVKYWLSKYKYMLLGLGLGLCLISLWYWFSKPDNSIGINTGEGAPISYSNTTDNTSTSTSTYDNIHLITYEDRYRVRRSIRESLFEDVRLSTQLQERNEELALETVNLNNSPISREEMIQRIRDSDVSPNTAIDAVQSLLREAARELSNGEENSNALISYNSITDLVIYNPENVPIPASVDLNRYEFFIQYLDHYNAIIAAYDFNILF
jgi:hypothetical protein